MTDLKTQIRFFFFLLLSLNISCNETIQCDKWVLGEFYTETESVGKVYIKRTKTQLIERVPLLNKETIFDLEWDDDCSFIMRFSSGDTISGPNGMTPIKCEIVETSEDSHIVKATIQGTSISPPLARACSSCS